MRLFLSAGEASGDAYGAALIAELPEATAEGVGGPKMLALAFRAYADSSHWGAIGIIQALMTVPRVIAGYYRAKWALGRGAPGVFVPIDFGYANLRLARHAKRLGWKVLYFVPPGSWRRDRQGADLPKLTDAIVTPFPWSAEMLNSMGANVRFLGHPLLSLIPPSFDPARSGIAVLPGSRVHEISENLPVIADVLRDRPEQVSFALAPTVDPARFMSEWSAMSGRLSDTFHQGSAWKVLQSAERALVCSGTATLEAAICRTPMVVMYRVSRAMEFEAKLIGFKIPKYVALPNILLDRAAVPELIQTAATVEGISAALFGDLSGQDAAFEELQKILGPRDAISQTAHWIRDLAQG